MSEFTNSKEDRIKILNHYMVGIIEGKSGAKLVNDLRLKAENFLPIDVLGVFDLLFDTKFDLQQIKFTSNKLFNILYKSLKAYPRIKPPKNSFIDCLIKDNAKIAQALKKIKPFIKQINLNIDENILVTLNAHFLELQKLSLHYTAKENILFPVLESQWAEHECLKLMWSFHDDIRQNLKKIIALLNSESFDLKAFNNLAGLLFFNISTIIFREERILFPIMIETLSPSLMDEMLLELYEIKLPFVKVNKPKLKLKKGVDNIGESIINFSTGQINVEQIEMIFNHLPVDITFVDENEKVRFFLLRNIAYFPEQHR